MEAELLLRLDTAKGELLDALVSGGDDLSADNKIRGQIIGLDLAKQLMKQYFEEMSQNGDDVDEED